MMSITNRKLLFWSIVVVVFGAAFVKAVPGTRQAVEKVTQSTGEQTTETQTTPAVTLKPTHPETPKFSVVYFTQEKGVTKIFKIPQGGGTPAALYSDATDAAKFRAVAGVKNDGSAIYLIVATPDQEFAGTLIEISTDGKAVTKTHREQLPYTTPPVVSPVGNKIARISFNNEETQFGFTVSLESPDGSDAKTIYTTDDSISRLDFSDDGSKLAIVKSTPAGGNQIVIIETTTGQNQGVYSTPGAILSLDYEPSGIVLSQAPPGSNKANEAEIHRVDADGKNVTVLTKNSASETALHFSPDSAFTSYIQVAYTEGLAAPGVAGNLVVLNLEKKTEAVIGKGVGVVGWVQ